MDKLQYQPKAHFFICCRSRDDKACCSQKQSEQLVQELKQWTKDAKLNKLIKVAKSSCLGFCEEGITACLYPQNQWFHKISLHDIENIKNMLEECAKAD